MIDLHKVVPLILFLMLPFVVRMREKQALGHTDRVLFLSAGSTTNADPDPDPDLKSKPKMGRNHKGQLKPK